MGNLNACQPAAFRHVFALSGNVYYLCRVLQPLPQRPLSRSAAMMGCATIRHQDVGLQEFGPSAASCQRSGRLSSFRVQQSATPESGPAASLACSISAYPAGQATRIPAPATSSSYNPLLNQLAKRSCLLRITGSVQRLAHGTACSKSYQPARTQDTGQALSEVITP